MEYRPKNRRTIIIKKVAAAFFAGIFCIPFVGAAADPTPEASSNAAGPEESTLSAALFSGTTTTPPESAWKSASDLKGVRMGTDARNHHCSVKYIAEWVRIQCDNLSTVRADLIAGEKRDLKFFKVDAGISIEGDNVVAQFSMRPGDRRVIQWTSPDLWWFVWQGDEGKMASGIESIGPVFGLMAQIDWATSSEPTISIY
jgi:hypothetical protein